MCCSTQKSAINSSSTSRRSWFACNTTYAWNCKQQLLWGRIFRSYWAIWLVICPRFKKLIHTETETDVRLPLAVSVMSIAHCFCRSSSFAAPGVARFRPIWYQSSPQLKPVRTSILNLVFVLDKEKHYKMTVYSWSRRSNLCCQKHSRS